MATATLTDKITALYVVYFDRAPDKSGLDFWYNAIVSGSKTLQDVSAAFSTHPQFVADFGGLTNQKFVEKLYTNMLGNAGDAGGIAFWTAALNGGMKQSDLVASFTTSALTADLAGAYSGGVLTLDEYNAAVIRQNSLRNRVTVAEAFDNTLGNATNVTQTVPELVWQDPAYQAGINILKGVTSDPATVTDKINLLNSLVTSEDSLNIINNGPPQIVGNGTFTLTESIVAATTGTPAQTAVYWGYDPSKYDSDDPGSPRTGGVPVADLEDFLTKITGLTLAQMGLIDADGTNPFANVTNLTLGNVTAGDAERGSKLIITYADGTTFNAEATLGADYMTFLSGLLFDENGNSRLYEKVIVPATPGTNATIQPIKLTTSVNNGGTVETGFTSSANDTIVAGRLDLLQGAYIDGGSGINTLEVDAKGTYAQPLELLNIQNVLVNNMPNFYTTDDLGHRHYFNAQGGYLDDSTYPVLSTDDDRNIDSWLDLNRATSIQKLTVTDEGVNTGGLDVTDGNLTIVGVRNAATLRLEGGFKNDVTVQYGAGQTGTLNLQLAVGDITGDINLLQNAAVLNIDSQGIENHMHNFFAGGSISRMIVTGTGAFGVDENLGSSFNQGRPVIIDASANTGGLDVTLDNHDAIVTQHNDHGHVHNEYSDASFTNVKITGTVTDDEITVNNIATSAVDGTVVIKASDGDNKIVADDNDIVTITSGSGDDNISAQDANKLVTINAGDGVNVIDADGSKNLDRVVNITTGSGNDTISAVRAGTVTIDAGNGANVITAAADVINITAGTGNDKITISGMDVTYLNADENDNNTTDLVGISELYSPGATLNIDAGAGKNTITLGRDVGTIPGGTDYGITALEGSSITGATTAGSTTSLFVENISDLSLATLTGITSVTMKEELTLTAEQFKSIGAANFSVYHSSFGATETLHIVVTQDTNLTDLLNGMNLSSNVRLAFEIHNGATLTLTASDLDKHVAVDGLTSDGLNGKIVITGAGANFDPFNNAGDQLIVEGGTIGGGTLPDPTLYKAEDVTIVRDGTYERPVPGGLVDTMTLGSTTATTALEVAKSIITEAQTLKFVGSQDITFDAGVVVDLGGEVALSGNDNLYGQTIDGVAQTDTTKPNVVLTSSGKPESDMFVIDMSALTGHVTGLTLNHFQDVSKVIGNGTARINIMLNADVGAVGVGKGLNSTGVAEYMVTSIDNDQDGDITDGNSATINLCDLTKGLTAIGLHGNGGNTLTINAVPWGLVNPHIVLEGDLLKNWSDEIKVNGNSDTENIGTVNVSYFTAGAPAIIDINNGGVTLGASSTGGLRKFLVDGINLNNAASATVNVTDGSAEIKEFADSAVSAAAVATAEAAKATAAAHVSALATLSAAIITGMTNTDALAAINAAALAGAITSGQQTALYAAATSINLGSPTTVSGLENTAFHALLAPIQTAAAVTYASADAAEIAATSGGTLKTLTLNATNDVTIDAALPDSLTKINASNVTGAFTGTIDHSELDGDATNFTFTGSVGLSTLHLDNVIAGATTTITGGTAGAKLIIDDTVDLSKATLANVNSIVLDNSAALTLNFTEYAALAAAGGITIDKPGDHAVLNLTGLDGQLFNELQLNPGISLGSLTLLNNPNDPNYPVVTLNSGTNLTGIDSLVIPEGITLYMTAAQYQELGSTTQKISGTGTLNITDLSSANLSQVLGVTTGFDLSLIASTVKDGSITMSGDYTLSNALTSTHTTADSLGAFKTVNMGAAGTLGLTLGFYDIGQADGLTITGGIGSTVNITEINLGTPASIDASGFNVDNLDVLNTLVTNHNIDGIFTGLISRVLKVIKNGVGDVTEVDQTVEITAGTSIGGDLGVFKTTSTPQAEVSNLILNLDGGTELGGDLDISSVPMTGLLHSYLQSLTINSNGDATTHNKLSGATANIIDADIDPLNGLDSGGNNNNLLKLTINANNALNIKGDVIFSSVVTGAMLVNEKPNAAATLTVNGTAAVTIKSLDITDNDIKSLTVTNNSTGTLTITDAATAAVDASGTTTDKEVYFAGTGNIVLGTADGFGVDGGSKLSVLDASALSGNLTLAKVEHVDIANFTFTAGSGVTTMTLDSDTLNTAPEEALLHTPIGWNIDFHNAKVGSALHLDGTDTFLDGALKINMGTNGTLYIDANTDLTNLDSLSFTGVNNIVLADGAILKLTAAEASGLHIVSGPLTNGDTVTTAKVNITGLGTAPVDLSGIPANMAGIVTLGANDVTLAPTTNLGYFTVQLDSLGLGTGPSTLNDMAGQTIRFANAGQADGRIITVINDADGTVNNVENSTNVVWNFNTITGTATAGKIDTSGYSALIGRVWVNDALVNGQNIESIFSSPSQIQTNPVTGIINLHSSTIVRVVDTAALSNLIENVGVNRTVELEAFSQLPGGLVFNNADKLVSVQNLTLELGGQANIGNVSIDDIVANSISNNNSFGTLTIDSLVANTTTKEYLYPEAIRNAIDANALLLVDSTSPYTPVDATKPNIVGNISSGLSRDELANVTLNATDAGLNTGTITFAETTNTTTNPSHNSTATLKVTGTHDINVTSVDTTDPDISTLVLNATGFTGVLTAPGASPALQLGTVEELDIKNGSVAAGTIKLGSAIIDGDSVNNAGVNGAQLSILDATGFGGTLNLGTLAMIDGTDDTHGVNPTTDAFDFTSGNGKTTLTLGADNSLHPTLATGSTWDFDFTHAGVGSVMTITNDVVWGASGILDIELGANTTLDIVGNVDLTPLVDNPLTPLVTEGLFITGTGAIEVAAGDTLTLTVAQEQALGVDVIGAGTVKIVGNASNIPLGAAGGTHIKTVGVDISGVTLIASPTAGFDSDATVDLSLAGDANIGTLAAPVLAGRTIIGSANKDTIIVTGTHGDTITGGALNDTLTGGSGNNTYNVDAGIDTIGGLKTGDVLNVSTGATADAALAGGFTATAATVNNGTVVLTSTGTGNRTIDMSLATGNNGFTINGGTSNATGLDTLIGSSKADILNGGNTNQTTGSQDTLTGNDGADIFQFNVGNSTPVAFSSSTKTVNIDRENIQVVIPDSATENLSIVYKVNGVTIVNPLLVPVTAGWTADQDAAAIATAFSGVTGFSALAIGNTAAVQGPNGSDLSITSVTGTGYAGTHNPGTEQNQVDHVAIGTSTPGADTVTLGEKYSVNITLAGAAVSTTFTYTAGQGGDPLTDAAIRDGLINTINTTSSDVHAASFTAGTTLGLDITDLDPTNGGFTTLTSDVGGYNGSGASDYGAATIASADTIMDFLSGTDKIQLGIADGSAANYIEAAAVGTFALAQTAAAAAFNGIVQYFLTSDAVDGGMLFFDANRDGVVDGVIKLNNITAANFAATDIIK